jgi:UDP-glucuronate 4-epimerase
VPPTSSWTTYLVTGALGAIGAWTVRSLLDRGHDVVTYDLGGSDHRLRLALDGEQLARLSPVEGDVTDLPRVEHVLDDHDVTGVIHLAALQVPFVRDDPVAGARVNVVGTVNVLEAVRRRGPGMLPLVYASSIAALAEPGREYPSTLYGVFKLTNEGTAARYFADYGVSSVGLRPHTVYGPGRDQGLTSAPTAAMAAAAAGRGYHIPFGGALQFQYVADAGEAFVRASEARRAGASVHHLDGPVATVPEVIAAIERAAPAAGRITADEQPLPFPATVDARSFVELVGGPVSRPLDQGVAETIARLRGDPAPPTR